MNEAYITFKDRHELINECGKLIKKEHLLDAALDEIEKLTRGKVNPNDTIRRSQIGSYFSSITQQIGNYIDKNEISISPKLARNIARVAQKAERVLRENIVLQTLPPLDVIKFKNVPVRHSYSIFGGREQRWGYGLHKLPFNEDGDSVTVADMPSHYTQSIHNHTLSEYCLILDGKTEGIYYPGGKKEKIYSTKKYEILHFSATTPHTLRNPSRTHTRNITFKQSVALTDWKPNSNLNNVKIIRARLKKGSLNKIKENQTVKSFTIFDKYYDYTLEIITLGKGTTYSASHQYDQFIFVINGNFLIKHKDIIKECKRNDFVVIDKNTEYTVEPKTNCRLYTIRT